MHNTVLRTAGNSCEENNSSQHNLPFEERICKIQLRLLRFASASGTALRMPPTILQVSRSLQFPHVSKPLEITHFRISHMLQWENLTPSSRHPVQLIISGVMSGALKAALHFSAVTLLNVSSFLIVAILASHVPQFKPQQEISFSMS